MLVFLTSNKKRQKQKGKSNWKTKNKTRNVALTLFLYIHTYEKKDHFLHYLVMNEKTKQNLLWCNSSCAFVCFNQACLPAVTEYTVL